MENNTIDIVNENLKLKEVLRYHQNSFQVVMAENQQKFQEQI